MKSGSGERVFVVRMWMQGGAHAGEPQWRGSIRETNSGLLRYIVGTADLTDFITARLVESGGEFGPSTAAEQAPE